MGGATPPFPLYAFTVWSGATFRTYSICQMFIFAVLKDKMRIFVMDTQLVTQFFSLCFLEKRGLKVQPSAYGGPWNFVELARGPHISKGWTPPVRAVNRINSTQACNSRIAFPLPVHPYECLTSVTTKRISMQVLAFTPVYLVSINCRLEFRKIAWKQVLIFQSCLTWKYRVLISSDKRNFPPLLHRVCRRPGVCIVNTANESTESGNR